MRCAIVHYHELALKGRNREYFEQRLVRNIQWTLKDLGVRRVENLRSRIRVVSEWIWYYVTFKPGARLLFEQPARSSHNEPANTRQGRQ